MRYGCVPVVRSTGGLADSVLDIDAAPGRGTGFVFDEYSAEAFQATLARVLHSYSDRTQWRAVQQRAMMADFSWRAMGLLGLFHFRI